MSFTLPPLNPLKAFEAVARCGSIAKAADELSVTTAAIGQQIRTAEGYFGVILLQRGHSRSLLTREGQELFAGISGPLQDIEYAVTQAGKNHGERRLVIRSYTALSRFWLFPRLSEFQQRRPDIDIVVKSLSPPATESDSRNMNAVFRVGNGTWADYDSIKVANLELIPVCTANYAAANGISGISDLDKAVLLASSQRLGDWQEWLSIFREGRPSPRMKYFETSLFSYEAAISGLGIALALDSFVDPQISRGELIVPFDAKIDLGKSYYLTWQSGRKASSDFYEFVDWMASVV